MSQRSRPGAATPDQWSTVDVVRAATALGPAAPAHAMIERVAANGERVDAAMTAGEAQWRVAFGSATGDTIDWLDVCERPARFAGAVGGRAIVVNGPSGAGKSRLLSVGLTCDLELLSHREGRTTAGATRSGPTPPMARFGAPEVRIGGQLQRLVEGN